MPLMVKKKKKEKKKDQEAVDHASLEVKFNHFPESPPLKRSLPRHSRAYQAFLDDATHILSTTDPSLTTLICVSIANAFERHADVVQEKRRDSWWNQLCSDAKQTYRLTRKDTDKHLFFFLTSKACIETRKFKGSHVLKPYV